MVPTFAGDSANESDCQPWYGDAYVRKESGSEVHRPFGCRVEWISVKFTACVPFFTFSTGVPKSVTIGWSTVSKLHVEQVPSGLHVPLAHVPQLPPQPSEPH